MATSGSLNTSNYSGRYLVFSWEIKNSQADRIETNKTTISWTLKGAGTANAGYYESGNFKIKIDGTTIWSQTKRIQLYNGTTVASGEWTFTHNSDGTKNFTAYVEASVYLINDINCTGQTTFELDTIPRASALVSNGSYILGVEGTFIIDRKSDTFKHRLWYEVSGTGGTKSGTIGSTSTAYISGQIAYWTPPENLATCHPGSIKFPVTFSLYTYTRDNVHVGTTEQVRELKVPDSMSPSCSIVWDDTTGIDNTYGYPVQGLSKLKITVSGTPVQGSLIESCVVNVGGVKYNAQNTSGNSYEVNTDVLKSSDDLKITATVTDQRGRTGTATTTVGVLAYAPPAVSSLTVHRCDSAGNEDDDGEYVKVTFNATVTSLSNKNTAAYKLRYKKTVVSNFSEVTLTALANKYTVSSYSYIFAATGNESYDVEVVATDKYNSFTRATTVSTAFTLLNFHPGGTGIGIGKVAENANRVEFGLPAEFRRAVFGKVYGLGELPAIPENANLNSYLESGVYSIRTDALAKTLANGPPLKEAGRLIVSGATGTWEGSGASWRYIEQRFVPYLYGKLSADRPAYIRYITQPGTDTLTYNPWFNEALKAYPVGSIHLRYDTQNPADLFGGTWTQITARVLRAGSAGSIGAEGSIADGSGRTYIDIAVWRRTA